MVVIDPPEPGRCCVGKLSCSRLNLGACCDLGFVADGWRAWSNGGLTRPAACIAAEAEVAALQGGIIARVQEIADGLWPNGTEKRDRVADALAAVLGPEPVEL
jgi:hypothetical protein